MLTALLRRSGADLPFGDPRAHHGVAMEGYYWRLTDAAAGLVVVALLSVNRDGRGGTWGTVALAATEPAGWVRSAEVPVAFADPRRLGVRLADAQGREILVADESGLRVDLGDDARLDVWFARPVPWPRRVLGGVGPAHLLPNLGQYWHPHLLGARVEGSAVLAGRAVALGGADAYAEKNWGKAGFPPVWWWGQAHGFERPDVCVAFAGGPVELGPRSLTAGALVVRLGDELIHAVHPPWPLEQAVGHGRWRLRARTARHEVLVQGDAAGGAPHRLDVPVPLERRVLRGVSAQHLAGHLELTVRRGGRTRFAGASNLAGLEHGGG
jgi:hypothetical protein